MTETFIKEFDLPSEQPGSTVREDLNRKWRAAAVEAGYAPAGEPEISVDLDNRGHWTVTGPVEPA